MITVTHPCRLDLFLSTHLSLSRAKAQTLIKLGHVLINAHVSKKSGHTLKSGDIVTYSLPSTVASPTLPPPTLNLLYEDTQIIVLDKPSGLTVHHGTKANSGTLTDGLLRHFPKIKSVGAHDRPGIVHRLDKYTEGIMVIAKTSKAYDHLVQQFKSHQVIKKYQAMVYGNLHHDAYILKNPIGKHPHKGHLKWVFSNGKPSETHIRVIQRFNTKTLVEALPITGRTHQIRVHLSYLGHPIIGDPNYGPKKDTSGQQLIAHELCFTHPKTHLKMTFKRPTISTAS